MHPCNVNMSQAVLISLIFYVRTMGNLSQATAGTQGALVALPFYWFWNDNSILQK